MGKSRLHQISGIIHRKRHGKTVLRNVASGKQRDDTRRSNDISARLRKFPTKEMVTRNLRRKTSSEVTIPPEDILQQAKNLKARCKSIVYYNYGFRSGQFFVDFIYDPENPTIVNKDKRLIEKHIGKMCSCNFFSSNEDDEDDGTMTSSSTI